MGVEVLKSFPWREYGVVFAVLFGSRARGRAFKGDWDIAVWLTDVEKDVDLLSGLAKFLKVREDNIDLVVLNDYEGLPCTLVIEILGKGVAVYYRDLGEYLDIKLKVLKPCFDFMIDAEKLNLLGAQISAVLGKWGQ